MSKMNLLLALLLPILYVNAQTIENDTLVRILREEIKYNMESYHDEEVPIYFISLRVNDNKNLVIQSDFGSSTVKESHQCKLTPQLRVGNIYSDNYSDANQNVVSTGLFMNENSINFPHNCASIRAIQETIWLALDDRYRTAANIYYQKLNKKSTGIPVVDSLKKFSPAPVVCHYERPYTPNEIYIDVEEWRANMNEVGTVFRPMKDLHIGRIVLCYDNNRTYYVNSDGTVVVQNRKCYRLSLLASAKAPDGTETPMQKDFFAYELEHLPSVAELKRFAIEVGNRAIALSKAPIAAPYTGPAIISGIATGVFMHEILGHRFEDKNCEISALKGEQIFPNSFQLYFAPSLKDYKGTDLVGYYLYDDEGVNGNRVDCVKNGVLSAFLSGRTVSDDFSRSNGHARASIGYDPMPRQSNLILETTMPYTEKQLRDMLINELKKQSKPYGYFFKTVNGGYTVSAKPNRINSFNIDPIEVFRIYADGRPDELVRGVSLIGTPLSVCSHVEAAGNVVEVFNGSCGSQSGWIPVSAVAPMVYVSQIETQSKQNASFPGGTDVFKSGEIIDGMCEETNPQNVIFRAMEDEMSHVADIVKKKQMEKPLFVDFNIKRKNHMLVISSLGSCIGMEHEDNNSLSVDILLGDSMITSHISTSYRIPEETLPHQLDYHQLRMFLCKNASDAYKRAVDKMAYKRNALRNHPMPEIESSVPQFLPLPPVVSIDDSALDDKCTLDRIEKLATRLSTVFNDYPSLLCSKVSVSQNRADFYRFTSEHQKIIYPIKSFAIGASVLVPTDSCHYKSRSYVLHVNRLEDINETMVEKELREFAQNVIQSASAVSVEDTYVGPVMYEEEAAADLFARRINYYAHSYRSPDVNRYDKKYNHLGQEIFDKKLSVTQFNDSVYHGAVLCGYHKTDANGVVPNHVVLIDHGILKRQLVGREPSYKSLSTTGNEHFNSLGMSPRFEIGMMHVSSDSTISHKKMYRQLMDLAIKAGNDYAYIVRKSRISPYKLIRVDARTGKEMELDCRASVPTMSEFKGIYSVSDEEIIYNRDPKIEGLGACYVVPKAVLLENVEMNVSGTNDGQAVSLWKKLKKQ